MKQDNQEGISKAVLEGKEDSVDRRIVPLFWPSLPLLYLLYIWLLFQYNTTLLIPSWLSRFIMPSTVFSTTLLLDLCSSYVLTLYILR